METGLDALALSQTSTLCLCDICVLEMYKPLDLHVVNDSELAKKLNKPSSPSHEKSAINCRGINTKDAFPPPPAADADDNNNNCDIDDEMDSGDDNVDADDVTEFSVFCFFINLHAFSLILY